MRVSKQEEKQELNATQAATARELIAGCVTPAQWREMIAKQVELALEGNKAALELLLEYGYGRPISVAPAADPADKPINTIVLRPPTAQKD